MPDYYVALVKEYLERKDFIVRTETKYKIRRKDSRGVLRTSYGDIDILAVTIKDDAVDELIIGEVKAEPKTKKAIKEINQRKFESKYVRQKIKDLFGSTNYTKYLFCWSWKMETRKYAEGIGIRPVSFEEIMNYLLKKVEENLGWFYLKDYPNLMLLQFLESEGLIEKSQ